jgi:Domain of unknown function (DUF4032)/Lipopolysaccharide kinase (Kdo/WaaP) family
MTRPSPRTSARSSETLTEPPIAPVFPRLRLRDGAGALLDLPWERPLADWSSETLHFKEYPVGPSRHLVRFLVASDRTYALKEEPLGVATTEYDVLRHLESMGLPAVTPVGLASSPERSSAILMTEYLAYSIQYRRLLMRFPLGPGPYRDRLLDAMAWLLIDLHRAGVFWGDCSLANTLFRRDGDKVQAFLVDAETSEIHPSLSDGQRAYDLEILVENVAFGLADVAALQGRSDAFDDAVAAAETVRTRYTTLWEELHLVPEVSSADRHAVRARIRRLNDLGFAVDEIKLDPTGPGGDTVHLRLAVTNRRFHAHELQKLTGLIALEGQARLLLNDLREYRAWLISYDKRPIELQEAADRWLRDVLEPSLEAILPTVGAKRDPLQAYCDVLEEKWILSELAGRDVGLEAAIEAYLRLGAPAPEDDRGSDSTIALDIDWSGGLDPTDSVAG